MTDKGLEGSVPPSPTVYLFTRRKASVKGLTLIVTSQVIGEGILEGVEDPGEGVCC